MKAKVKTTVGDVQYEFDVEEKNSMETLQVATVLGNPPQYCKLCQNTTNFTLDSNKDKEGNIYVNVVCGQCYAKAKLGQYKSGGFFWHRDFEKYVKPSQQVPEGFEE